MIVDGFLDFKGPTSITKSTSHPNCFNISSGVSNVFSLDILAAGGRLLEKFS